MKIKVSKTILEAALIYQAKNDIRYYLNGVCFKKDGRVCSTDGHRAFIGSKHTSDLKEDVILKIQKPPVKRYDFADLDTDSGIVTYFNQVGEKEEDRHRLGVGICEVIDGRFPDIDRIIPKERQAVDRIGFNAGYLASIGPAAKLFNGKWECATLEFSGANSAAIAHLKSPCGLTGMVIIMPMRID